MKPLLSSRLVLSLVTLSTVAPGLARAQEEAADGIARSSDPGPKSELETEEQGLGVEIEIAETSLEEARIILALEQELRVPVRSTDQGDRLILRVHGSSLDASYGSPTGRNVSRHVELPTGEAQQLELIALLSGNLVRDEARTLLERLRPSSTQKAENPSKATPVAASPSEAQETMNQGPEKQEKKPRAEMPASLTLFSPISTDPRLSAHEAHFDVSVAYSDIGRLSGMAVGAGVLHVEDGGRGFEVAGIGSTTGPFQGMNVSGIYGVDGGAQGMSVAGIYLRHKGPSQGLSVSLVNVAAGGQTNVETEPSTRGAMIGLVNIGANLKGAQIGLVNVQTGTMRGAQIGLVNVSKDLHGGAIGLVNAGPHVRIQGLAWASMSPELDNPARQAGPMAHLGVKYRIRQFYSLIGFGVAAEASGCGTDPGCPSKDVLFAPSFGAGYSFPLGESFALEVDGLYQLEFSPRGAANAHGAVAGRVTAVWSLSQQFSFFAGGGPRVVLPGHDHDQTYFAPTFHAGIELF